MSLVDYLGLILTPTGGPVIGDIPMRGQSGGWTTVSASDVNIGSVLHIETIDDEKVPVWSNAPYTLTYSRSTETPALTQIRESLVALGLVTDETTA